MPVLGNVVAGPSVRAGMFRLRRAIPLNTAASASPSKVAEPTSSNCALSSRIVISV